MLLAQHDHSLAHTKSIPLVRQYLIEQVAEELEAQNVNVERHLNKRRLPDWRSMDPGLAIPLPHYLDLFELGVRTNCSMTFGAEVARGIELRDFQSYGAAIGRSEIVFDAMQTACKRARQQASTLKFWLHSVDGGYLFCRKQFARVSGCSVALAQLEQYTLNLLTKIVQLGAGPDWKPKHIYLSCSRDMAKIDEEVFPDATLHFEWPFSAIHVPFACIVRPIHQRGRKSLPKPNVTGSDFEAPWSDGSFSASCRALMRSLALEGECALDSFADTFGLSRRTIQRWLAEEGTTLKELRAEVLMEIATELLSGSEASVVEIADLLGYQNASHFSRAFRNWAGVAPSAYRKVQMAI